MNCTFIGKYFAFPKFCSTMDEIQETIKRCDKAYTTRGEVISKKITWVLAEIADGLMVMDLRVPKNPRILKR